MITVPTPLIVSKDRARAPAAYLPNLAIGIAWARTGGQAELDEVLTASQEAVAISEALAEALPAAIVGYSGLQRLRRADVLDNLGRCDEATELRQHPP
ncbi:MAG: hypothetical protein ACRDSL_23570 [Pseudonocardiaceae bacterium]